MVVEEIQVPIVINSHGESFLEINRNGLLRYVRMRNIPGGVEGAEEFFKHCMRRPFFELADDLLTSELQGGLSAVDSPDSYDLESGACYKDKQAGYRSLRFDYFQIEQIDPTKPRSGRIAIHYSPVDPDDESEPMDAELAIQFEIEYPSVALFLPGIHPYTWLNKLYDELEDAGDAYFALAAFNRFAEEHDIKGTWKIGLPRKMDCGMSLSAGTEFLNLIAHDESILISILERHGVGSSKFVLNYAHGIQENTCSIVEFLRTFDYEQLSSRMMRALVSAEMEL